MHALDPSGLVSAGLLPVDGDAAGLRRRVELGLADLVEHLYAHPAGWPMDIAPPQVAAGPLDGLSRPVRAECARNPVRAQSDGPRHRPDVGSYGPFDSIHAMYRRPSFEVANL